MRHDLANHDKTYAEHNENYRKNLYPALENAWGLKPGTLSLEN